MTDIELLELAAKAAGIEYDVQTAKPHPISGAFFGLWRMYRRELTESDQRYWNPLTDDDDALRLAVKLEISVAPFCLAARVITNPDNGLAKEHWSKNESIDPYTATRRAIVSAAAEIGKAQSTGEQS